MGLASDAQTTSNPVLGRAGHNSSSPLSDLPINSVSTYHSQTTSASSPEDKEVVLVKRQLFNRSLPLTSSWMTSAFIWRLTSKFPFHPVLRYHQSPILWVVPISQQGIKLGPRIC